MVSKAYQMFVTAILYSCLVASLARCQVDFKEDFSVASGGSLDIARNMVLKDDMFSSQSSMLYKSISSIKEYDQQNKVDMPLLAVAAKSQTKLVQEEVLDHFSNVCLQYIEKNRFDGKTKAVKQMICQHLLLNTNDQLSDLHFAYRLTHAVSSLMESIKTDLRKIKPEEIVQWSKSKNDYFRSEIRKRAQICSLSFKDDGCLSIQFNEFYEQNYRQDIEKREANYVKEQAQMSKQVDFKFDHATLRNLFNSRLGKFVMVSQQYDTNQATDINEELYTTIRQKQLLKAYKLAINQCKQGLRKVDYKPGLRKLYKGTTENKIYKGIYQVHFKTGKDWVKFDFIKASDYVRRALAQFKPLKKYFMKRFKKCQYPSALKMSYKVLQFSPSLYFNFKVEKKKDKQQEEKKRLMTSFKQQLAISLQKLANLGSKNFDKNQTLPKDKVIALRAQQQSQFIQLILENLKLCSKTDFKLIPQLGNQKMAKQRCEEANKRRCIKYNNASYIVTCPPGNQRQWTLFSFKCIAYDLGVSFMRKHQFGFYNTFQGFQSKQIIKQAAQYIRSANILKKKYGIPEYVMLFKWPEVKLYLLNKYKAKLQQKDRRMISKFNFWIYQNVQLKGGLKMFKKYVKGGRWDGIDSDSDICQRKSKKIYLRYKNFKNIINNKKYRNFTLNCTYPVMKCFMKPPRYFKMDKNRMKIDLRKKYRDSKWHTPYYWKPGDEDQ